MISAIVERRHEEYNFSDELLEEAMSEASLEHNAVA
jgi:hypothetical protein